MILSRWGVSIVIVAERWCGGSLILPYNPNPLACTDGGEPIRALTTLQHLHEIERTKSYPNLKLERK